ncbi:unnamed protein product [Gadus morhua 'NCC']
MLGEQLLIQPSERSRRSLVGQTYVNIGNSRIRKTGKLKKITLLNGWMFCRVSVEFLNQHTHASRDTQNDIHTVTVTHTHTHTHTHNTHAHTHKHTHREATSK